MVLSELNDALGFNLTAFLFDGKNEDVSGYFFGMTRGDRLGSDIVRLGDEFFRLVPSLAEKKEHVPFAEFPSMLSGTLALAFDCEEGTGVAGDDQDEEREMTMREVVQALEYLLLHTNSTSSAHA